MGDRLLRREMRRRNKRSEPRSDRKPLPHRFNQGWSHWLSLLLIFLMAFVAYYPAIHGGFIWDDDLYVTENHLLTAPDGLRRIWFTTESPSQYFPLTYTVFWVERRLWGLQPMGYHIVNVALHALNAVLVWLLLIYLKLRGAWLVGAIFALHPVHVESVAWITELKNVLSGMFYLLALGSYLRFEDNRGWGWYAGAFGLFGLSLLSKTVTLTLPVGLLLLRWLRGREIRWRNVGLLIPFIVLGVGMGLLSRWWEIHYQGTRGEVFDLSMLQRFLIAGRAFWFYTIKLLWPMNLTFSYPRWTLNPLEAGNYVWHLGLILSGLGLWLLRDRWGRGPLVGTAFFMITLSPMLGFINYYTMRYSFVADHYQYVASLGLTAVVVGSVCGGLDQWEKTIIALTSHRGFLIKMFLGVTVLIILGVLTWRQGYVYRDSEVLWQDTLTKNPESWMAYNNLGLALGKQGRLEEGIEHFQKSLVINPNNVEAHYNLGLAYYKKGSLDKAISRYKKALAINPHYAEVHNNLGIAYSKKGIVDEAISEYKKSLDLKPNLAEAHNNLSVAYYHKENYKLAIVHCNKAVELGGRVNPKLLELLKPYR